MLQYRSFLTILFDYASGVGSLFWMAGESFRVENTINMWRSYI